MFRMQSVTERPKCNSVNKSIRTFMSAGKKFTKLLPTWKNAFFILCLADTLGVLLIITYYSTYLSKTIAKRNYVIEADECERDSNIYMLVLVGSHPDHGEIRNAIRQTWGNPRLENYKFKLVFLFGKVTNTSQEQQLHAEHAEFRDILTGNFVDAYHNVTLRDLMGLTWAVQHCQQVRYILRADDDIALDIFTLISTLEKTYNKAINLIACFAIINKAIPKREGRYAVSEQEYPHQYYPDYCDGWAYVLTPVVAQEIVLTAQRRKPFWVNDVYITGILIEDLMLKHVLLNLRFTYSYVEMLLFAQKFNLNSDDEITYELGPVQQNASLLLQLQEIYEERYQKQLYK